MCYQPPTLFLNQNNVYAKLVINLQPLGRHSCLPCFRCFPLDEMSCALDVLLSRSLLGEPR